MSNAAKKSAPGSITKAEVTSNANTGKTANLVNGIIRMTYYESILQDSIKANIIFGDVGLAVDNKSVIEGLPLIGTEDIKLQFEDNNEKKVRVKMNVWNSENKICLIADFFETNISESVRGNHKLSEKFLRIEEILGDLNGSVKLFRFNESSMSRISIEYKPNFTKIYDRVA